MTPKRVTVYIDEEDYRKLRAKLILLGLTVSGWFRKIIRDFIDVSSSRD